MTDLQPRVIRLKDIPHYLGMTISHFNKQVRPYISELRYGPQSVGFDRVDLDEWVMQNKQRSERPSHESATSRIRELTIAIGDKLWDARDQQDSGLRDREVCTLRWEWEIPVPQLGTSVFVVPQAKTVKDRMVVLNDAARDVIEDVRSEHPEFVFVYDGKPMRSINSTAWQKARKRAGLPVRVHDLKHTFGRRLRSAGVSFEDRQDLLGHTSGRITTHYSRAEISNLIEAANTVSPHNLPTLTLVRAGAA